MQDELHTGLPPRLTLDTVAEGHLNALIQRELARVAENISDPNTSTKAKRKIQINLDLLPYLDRSGATVSTTIKTSLAGLSAIESPMYIAKVKGEYQVYGKNHKQTALEFDMAEKQAAEDGAAAKKPQ